MILRHRFLAARVAYVGVVLLATLTDLSISWDRAAAAQRLVHAMNPSLGWRDAIDGLRNVALFAGLGTTWVVTSLSGKVRTEIRNATIVGFALSTLVEGLQTFSPTRTASVIDLSTNTLGAFAGAYVFAAVVADLHRAKGARSYLGVPVFLITVAYGVSVLSEALTPLFSNVLLSDVEGGPLDWLRWSLQVSTPLLLSEFRVGDVPLFAPAGFLLVMMLSERGWDASKSWLGVAGVGAALLVAAELAHGAARLPIRWEAVAAHTLALGLGSWGARRWLAPLSRTLRGAERARAAAFAYGILLVLWGWRPFLPETSGRAIAAQLTADHFVPLQALAGRADVFSAVHVGQQFLLYLPLGSLLAVWPLRLTGRWAHLWPGVLLAVTIEAGHVVIAGRFLDVTNILLALAGLGIGWLMVRRAGFRPYGAALEKSAFGV